MKYSNHTIPKKIQHNPNATHPRHVHDMMSRNIIGIRTSSCVYVCFTWMCGHLGVWGELAGPKRYLTHCPSSQGWPSRCPTLYICFVCRYMYTSCVSVLGGGRGRGISMLLDWVPFFLFSASVLHTCIFMYIYMYMYIKNRLYVNIFMKNIHVYIHVLASPPGRWQYA